MEFEIYSIADISITEDEPRGGNSDGFILRACVRAVVWWVSEYTLSHAL